MRKPRPSFLSAVVSLIASSSSCRGFAPSKRRTTVDTQLYVAGAKGRSRSSAALPVGVTTAHSGIRPERRRAIPIVGDRDLQEHDEPGRTRTSTRTQTQTQTQTERRPRRPKNPYSGGGDSSDYLPDFMRKDPLAVTKQRWRESSQLFEEESHKGEDDMDMVMTALGFGIAIAVIYALASTTPEILDSRELNESEGAIRELVRGEGEEGGLVRFVTVTSQATSKIVATALPGNAEDAIAVTLGEGIAGVIGSVATSFVGVLLNLASDEELIEAIGETKEMEMEMDLLVSETVASGDYFLTRAAAQPILEALGFPIFLASLVSVLIASVPYEAVKLISKKQRAALKNEVLLNMLVEEEERRQREQTVVDKVSNGVFDFIQKLNVRSDSFDDDDESDDFDIEEEFVQPEIPGLDYIELFADVTKWLEYDVLVNSYRGVLALPNGQMLGPSLESAVFGILAALSSQLYTDVLYLYSDFGDPEKREDTLNRSARGWTKVYVTKCVSSATLFGVYELAREPTSRLLSRLVSGGIEGCAGSSDYDLCLETFLYDNPPSGSIVDEFGAFADSVSTYSDGLFSEVLNFFGG